MKRIATAVLILACFGLGACTTSPWQVVVLQGGFEESASAQSEQVREDTRSDSQKENALLYNTQTGEAYFLDAHHERWNPVNRADR